MKRISLFAALALLLCAASLTAAQEAQTPTALCESAVPASEPETHSYTQPEQVLETGVDYRAVFCTDAGAVYVDLLENYAPITVNNFVFLAQNSYYNNTTFHRVIPNFMAQGGDPTASGSGGPGYEFADEFVGFLSFDKPGWLAMANAGPGTNGSQFFITTTPTPHLDYKHTIFGEVLEGQENVVAIETRDPQTASTPGTTLQAVLIITDPSTVDTTYSAPEPATQQDVVEALVQIDGLIPDTFTHTVTELTTDEVIAATPDNLQADYEEFLTTHKHQFRIADELTVCDPANVPFSQASYTLDAFASDEDASAALASTLLAELQTSADRTATDQGALPNPMYIRTTTACDTSAVNAVTHWRRGHYLVTVEITIPADSPATPDLWLSDIIGTRLYEPVLADVLRREIR